MILSKEIYLKIKFVIDFVKFSIIVLFSLRNILLQKSKIHKYYKNKNSRKNKASHFSNKMSQNSTQNLRDIYNLLDKLCKNLSADRHSELIIKLNIF